MPVYSPYDPATVSAFRPRPYQRYDPWSSMPFAPLVNMALTAMDPEMQPGGGFHVGINPQSNLYRNVQQQMLLQAHNQALRDSARDDLTLTLERARGVYAAKGREHEFTTQTAQDVAGWHDLLATMAPMADSPQALRGYDALHGGRSRLPLTHYLHHSGRMLLDPETGRRSLSAASSRYIADAIHNEFFSDPRAFLQKTGGLTSAEFGELAQELISSGRMRLDPRLEAWGRPEAAEQVNETLRGYSKVIGTIKEIFQAEGRGNTPMQELIDAADALTGGLQQIDPVHASRSIRKAYAAAQQLGLGFEAIDATMRMSAGHAQMLGVNEAFALPVAAEGLNFRLAATQLQLLSTPAWGLKTLDQLQLMNQQQTMQFIASEGGNRIGMLHRLLQRHFLGQNGRVDVSQIQGDSQMSRALRALASGDLNDADLAAVLSGDEGSFVSGAADAFDLDAAQIQMEMQFHQQNQEQVHRFRLHEAAMSAQREELRNLLFGGRQGGGFFGQPTEAAVLRLLGDSAAGGDLARSLSKVSSDALHSADAATKRDHERLARTMAGAMKSQLETVAAGDGPQAEAARELLSRLRGSRRGLEDSLFDLAQQQYATVENIGMQLGILDGNLINYLLQYGYDTQTMLEEARAAGEVDAYLSAALQGTINPDLIGRFVNNLDIAGQEGKGDWKQILKDTLGVTPTDQQAAMLNDLFARIDAQRDALVAEYDALGPSGGSTEKIKDLWNKLQEEVEGLEIFLNDPAQAELKKAMEQQADGSLGQDTVAGDLSQAMGLPNLSFTGASIYLNGDLVATNVRGGVTQTNRGGGPVPV